MFGLVEGQLVRAFARKVSRAEVRDHGYDRQPQCRTGGH